MRRSVSLVLAGCVLAVAPAAAYQPAPRTANMGGALDHASRAAAHAVDRFHVALAQGDTAAALALLSDDVLIYEQGGVERSKVEYASHHLGSDTEFARSTRRETTARSGRASRDLAVITSESRTTGRFRDRDIDSLGVETMVLRRERDRWRIVHVHWSSRSRPAAR